MTYNRRGFIVFLVAALVASGILYARESTDEALWMMIAGPLIASIDEAARAEADHAADFAEASPYPTVDDIQKDVYWESDNPAERKSEGRLFFD